MGLIELLSRQCCRLAQGAVTLQSPGYADAGPFAINMWAKAANTSEQGPQYIFSHEAANSTSSGVYNPWTSNMVCVFFLSRGLGSTGCLHAIDAR